MKTFDRNQISDIERDLKNKLDKNRYQHTLGVAYVAASLAMCYGCDVEKARLAGLLHDCAKCMPQKKKIRICAKYGIPVSDVESMHPSLLHAKLGAFLAVKEYHIHDEEIISAIQYHTTGKPDMSLLDKIIYVADYIEPNRRRAPRLSEIRRTAFCDLDRALLMILEDTLQFLKTNNGKIDSITQKTYEYYKNAQRETNDNEYANKTEKENAYGESSKNGETGLFGA